MKKRRKSAALADSVDRMFGYFALVVLLCAFTIMSLGAFLYLLAGALVIAVLALVIANPSSIPTTFCSLFAIFPCLGEREEKLSILSLNVSCFLSNNVEGILQ